MNIVFWLLVADILVIVWIAMSSVFKDIGGFVLQLWRDIKEEISDDDSDEYFENENEEEDDSENEG